MIKIEFDSSGALDLLVSLSELVTSDVSFDAVSINAHQTLTEFHTVLFDKILEVMKDE